MKITKFTLGFIFLLAVQSLSATGLSRYEKSENDRINTEGFTTVSGQVFNIDGHRVISEIQLHRGKEYSPYRYSAITTTTTDRNGNFSLFVPAPLDGGFRLIVLLGSEYEFVEIPFDVEENHNTTIDVNIARIIEDQTLEGWYSGDGHQHSGGPLGSGARDPYNEVALYNVATGNSWGVLSDHRHMNATRVFTEELQDLSTDFAGNDSKFFSLRGYEWTAGGQGHMNVFGPGADLFLSQDFRAISDTMMRNAIHAREILEFQAAGAFVQANHPTSVRLRFMRGGAGYDRAWFMDGFEVWNGGGAISVAPYEEMDDPSSVAGIKPFNEWFNLLNMGVRVAGTATTDCHDLDVPAKLVGETGTIADSGAVLSRFMNLDGSLDEEYYNNGGFDALWALVNENARYSRLLLSPALHNSMKGLDKAASKSMIASAFESDIAPRIALFIAYLQGSLASGTTKTYVHIPNGMSEQNLMAGLRNGQSFMSNGPILRAELNGQEPDVRYGHEALLNTDGTATLSIDMTSNRNIDHIYIVADGEMIRKIAVGSTTYDNDITLDLRGKHWVVVDARGDRFAKAITNPIFVAMERTKDVLASKSELSELVKSTMRANPDVEMVGVTSPEQPEHIVRLRKALDRVVRPVLFNENATEREVERAIATIRATVL